MASVDDGFSRHLARIVEELGLSLSGEQFALLEGHYATLQRWNRKINLTAIRDPAEIAERHFGESLFLARELGASPASLLDVGSGAGFPGMPVAVCHPTCEVSLLEPVGKKFAFLKEISRSIPNVSVLQGRLRDVEGTFEWATIRGVAVIPILAELVTRARHLGILTTQRAVGEIRLAGGIAWEKQLILPWGNQRVLLVGQSSSDRPRST